MAFDIESYKNSLNGKLNNTVGNNNYDTNKKSNANALERINATALDVDAKLKKGAFKALEGLVDFGATNWSMFFGLFNKDIENSLNEFVKKDYSSEFEDFYRKYRYFDIPGIQSTKQEDSYIKELNETTQEVVYGVIEGVGQMLPSIAVGAVTGGASIGAGVVSADLGTLTFMASASGNSSENALNQGATTGQALGYGITSGILEGSIEKISGGIGGTSVGARAGQKASGKLLTRIGSKFIGEGLEEVASDLIDPANQVLWGMKDSYEVPELEDLAKTFTIGGMTGVALGGAEDVSLFSQYGSNGVQLQELNKRIVDIDYKIVESARLGKNTSKLENERNELIKKGNELINKIDNNISNENKETFEKVFNGELDFDSLDGKQRRMVNQLFESSDFVENKEFNKEKIQTSTLFNKFLKDKAKGLKFVDDDTINKLSEKKDENGNVIKRNGKVFGINKDGVIYINKGVNGETERSYVKTLLHEISHNLEKSKSYNTLLDSIKEYYGENVYNNLVNKKKKTYNTTDDVYASQEVVADSIYEILNSDYNTAYEFFEGINNNGILSKFKSLLFGNKSNTLNEAQTALKDVLNDDISEYNEELKESKKDSLINNTFPEYNKSKSEANQIATRWAKNANKEDIGLVSYHDRFYLITTFDNDFGYIITKRVLEKDLNNTLKEIEERNEEGIKRNFIRYNKLVKTDYENFGDKPISNSVFDGHRQEDNRIYENDRKELQLSNRKNGNNGRGIDEGSKQNTQRSEVNKTRYSLSDEVDSEGNTLTNEQAKYFKSSLVRDDEGNLLVVYHSTFENFTIFDINKTSRDNFLGKGHYFSTSIDDIEKHYVKASNRNDVDTKINDMVNDILYDKGITQEDLESNDKEIIDAYNEAYEVASNYYSRENANIIKAYLNIINPLYVEKGENVNVPYNYVLVDSKGNVYEDVPFHEAYNFAIENEFDGIIDKYTPYELRKNEEGTIHIIAFESNQIKSTDNLTPTKNPDIRYSLEDKPALSDNNMFKNLANLKVGDMNLDDRIARAKSLVTAYDSYKNSKFDDFKKKYDDSIELYEYLKSLKGDDVSKSVEQEEVKKDSDNIADKVVKKENAEKEKTTIKPKFEYNEKEEIEKAKNLTTKSKQFEINDENFSLKTVIFVDDIVDKINEVEEKYNNEEISETKYENKLDSLNEKISDELEKYDSALYELSTVDLEELYEYEKSAEQANKELEKYIKKCYSVLSMAKAFGEVSRDNGLISSDDGLFEEYSDEDTEFMKNISLAKKMLEGTVKKAYKSDNVYKIRYLVDFSKEYYKNFINEERKTAEEYGKLIQNYFKNNNSNIDVSTDTEFSSDELNEAFAYYIEQADKQKEYLEHKQQEIEKAKEINERIAKEQKERKQQEIEKNIEENFDIEDKLAIGDSIYVENKEDYKEYKIIDKKDGVIYFEKDGVKRSVKIGLLKYSGYSLKIDSKKYAKEEVKTEKLNNKENEVSINDEEKRKKYIEKKYKEINGFKGIHESKTKSNDTTERGRIPEFITKSKTCFEEMQKSFDRFYEVDDIKSYSAQKKSSYKKQALENIYLNLDTECSFLLETESDLRNYLTSCQELLYQVKDKNIIEDLAKTCLCFKIEIDNFYKNVEKVKKLKGNRKINLMNDYMSYESVSEFENELQQLNNIEEILDEMQDTVLNHNNKYDFSEEFIETVETLFEKEHFKSIKNTSYFDYMYNVLGFKDKSMKKISENIKEALNYNKQEEVIIDVKTKPYLENEAEQNKTPEITYIEANNEEQFVEETEESIVKTLLLDYTEIIENNDVVYEMNVNDEVLENGYELEIVKPDENENNEVKENKSNITVVENIEETKNNSIEAKKENSKKVSKEANQNQEINNSTRRALIKAIAELKSDSVFDYTTAVELKKQFVEFLEEMAGEKITVNQSEEMLFEIFKEMNNVENYDLNNVSEKIRQLLTNNVLIDNKNIYDYLGEEKDTYTLEKLSDFDKTIDTAILDMMNIKKKKPIVKGLKEQIKSLKKENLDTLEFYALKINQIFKSYDGLVKLKNKQLRDTKIKHELLIKVKDRLRKINNYKDRVGSSESNLYYEQVGKLSELINETMKTNCVRISGKFRFNIGDLTKIFNKETFENNGIDWTQQHDEVYNKIKEISENANDESKIHARNKDGEVISYKSFDAEELSKLKDILGFIEGQIKTYEKINLGDGYENISDIVKEAKETISKNKKFSSSKVNNYLRSLLKPKTIFEKLDRYTNGVLTKLYNGLRNGDNRYITKKTYLSEKINDFVRENKYNERLEETVDFNGNELKVGEAIYLHMGMKRLQFKNHVKTSGFQVYRKKATIDIDYFDGFEKELRNILSPKDLEFVDILSDMFDDKARLAKMEVDIERFGFSNVEKGHYVPIIMAKDGINQTVSYENEYTALASGYDMYSINKDVKKAVGRIAVTNVLDIAERHIEQISRYYGYQIALSNFNKVLNSKVDGKTLLSACEEKMEGFTEYLRNFLSDVRGSKTIYSNDIKMFDRLRGNVAKFYLGLNVKVYLNQMTSLPSAYKYISANNLRKGFFQNLVGSKLKSSIEQLKEYCNYAKYRIDDLGYLKAEGLVEKIDSFAEWTTKGIKKFDTFTISRLWNACVLETNGDLVKAGELLEEVIRDTQPNFIQTERSSLSRSKNELIKSFMMFTTQPLTNLNNLYNSVDKYRILKEDNASSTDINLAKSQAKRATVGLLVQALCYTAVGQLFKRLLDKDDDLEKTLKGQSLDVLKDLFENGVISMFPIVKDVYNKIFNGYSISNNALTAIEDMAGSVKTLLDSILALTKGEKVDYNKTLRDITYGLGMVTGIPFKNIYTQSKAIVALIDKEAGYYLDNKVNGYSQSKNTETLNKLIENKDYSKAKGVFNVIQKEKVDIDDEELNELFRLYKKGFTNVSLTNIPSTISVGDETIVLDDKLKEQFKKEYSYMKDSLKKMLNSNNYKSLSDEEKVKAIRKLNKIYYEYAKAKISNQDNKYSVLVESGVDISEISYHLSYIENLKGSTNIKAYINSLRISSGLKTLIYSLAGYTINNNKTLKQYLRTLGLTNKDIELFI